MSNVIRELAVKLGLQAEGFNKGIKDALREAKEFEKNWKPTLTLAKDMGLAVGAAGTAIAGGMLVAAKSAIDYGDALNDARQRTGIAVEQLAKFGFAAEQSGSDVGALAIGLKGLANNMQAAAAGGKSQLEAFASLGISASTLASAHGDLNQVMLLVADRFAAMEDGAAKSALAVDIFGKAGVGLIPMLNEGSAGLKKLGDEAQAAGLVISKETAEAADKLNDKLNLLKASALGAAIQIGTALTDSLQSATEAAITGTQAFAGFIKEHQALTTAAFIGATAIGGIGTAITGAGLFIPPFVKGLGYAKVALLAFTDLMALGGGAVGSAVVFTAAMVTLGYELWNLHDAWKASIVAQGDATVAQSKMEESTIRAAKALKDGFGVEVPRGTKSWADWSAAIAVAAHNAAEFTVVGGALAEKVKTVGQMMGEQSQKLLDQEVHYRTLEEHMQVIKDLQEKQKESEAALTAKRKEATDATKALADEQTRLKDSFNSELKPAEEVAQKMNALVGAGEKLNDVHVLYAKKMVESAKQQRDNNQVLSAAAVEAERAALAYLAIGDAALTAAAKTAAAAAAAKATTGFLNPSAPDADYNPFDPFGLNAKNKALTDKFANPAIIAPQPGLPAAFGGGGGSPMGPPMQAGGNYFPGGWVNGSYYPESGKAQGTSAFNVNAEFNPTIVVQKGSSMDEINDQLTRGIGLEKLTRMVFNAQNGVTSTKGG